MTAPNPPSERQVADYVAADVAAIRSTVVFLASVIQCGEPYTSKVAGEVDDALGRLNRLLAVEPSQDLGDSGVGEPGGTSDGPQC